MTYPQPPSPPEPEPRPLDAAQSIAPALRHMWAMLTRPFSLRKWLALGLITLLAGMFGNFSFWSGGGDWPSDGDAEGIEPHLNVLAQWASENVALLVAFGLVLLLLTVATVYLAAVFRFVFLDSVARNRVAMKRAFVENWDRGLSLFLWHIGMTVVTVIVVGLAVAATVLPFVALWRGGVPTGQAIGLTVLLGLFFSLIWIVLIIALVLIGVTLVDFVLPVMYLEDVGIWAAWRRTIGLIRRQLGAFALYFVLKIPVGIAADIATGLLALAGIVVALIPLGIIALIVYAIAAADQVAWAWTPTTIFLTVFGGGIVLIYVLYAMACASLPVPVFNQAWALWFLGERDRRLAVLNPRAPTPGV